MELGNIALDSTGANYTIMSYLDQKYTPPVVCDPLDNTTVCFGNEYEAVRWNHPSQHYPEQLFDPPGPSVQPAVSLQHGVGAFRAMQPQVQDPATKPPGLGLLLAAASCQPPLPTLSLSNRRIPGLLPVSFPPSSVPLPPTPHSPALDCLFPAATLRHHSQWPTWPERAHTPPRITQQPCMHHSVWSSIYSLELKVGQPQLSLACHSC